MPRRGDYKHRESKKPKKESKKIPPVDILETPATIEVIGKGGKKKKQDEVE